MSASGNGVQRWLRRLVKFIVIAALVAGGVYWLKFAPVSVAEYVVQRGPLVAEVMGTGTLEARVQATISPKISNRIEQLLVDQGDRVSAGSLLVRLDDDELQQQVAIAQASLESEAAAIERIKTDKQRAIAVFEQAQASFTRIQSLIKKNAVSQDDLDKATEALAVATIGISHAEAAIAEGQKKVVAAERTLEYHRARLTDTEIVAPFDGMIVKRSRELGDVVVPGSSILTLISLDELWIRAWIDETEMAKLAEGQSARVVFRSEPEKSYPGKVVRLGKEADRETREFIVDVRVLELASNWAVGQRAEVFIEVSNKQDVVQLPADKVLTRDGEKGVFVREARRSLWRPITTGLRSRDAVEITDGLQADDIVLAPTGSHVKLSDGRKVSVSQIAAPQVTAP
ncbi:MAG: efflux RND transporter periplasmic adaptor subunit [Planctomycetes bacterium]|nr:efflux RND transporter periplasmic adaptor subunit [Planctomycetota bacterium]